MTATAVLSTESTSTVSPRRPRTALYLLALSVTALLLAVGTLWALPYSRVDFTGIGPDEEARPPTAAGFALGPLRWDLDAYAGAAELEPFRAFVGERCGAARTDVWTLTPCLVDAMSASFDQGDPTVEFLGADFDPAGALAGHLGGEPGHCISRSALLATALLSVRVPARVVQFLTVGHTIVEVWDGVRWSRFDPSSGVALVPADEAREGDVAVGMRGVVARPVATAPRGGGVPEGYFAPEETGPRVYPDPWLYTRVGRRASRWPFPQAAAVASASAEVGVLQPILGRVAGLSLVAALASFVVILRGGVGRPRSAR